MVEPVVRLEPTRLSVEPGAQAVATVTVFNPGTVVEGYDVDVVSTVPMPWATASPATLSVYPQQEASSVVTFAPPRGHDTPGGTFPFGVRLRSQVDPTRSAVAEGDLAVGAVSGLRAALTPVTSSGRWRGSHTLEVENLGNLPAQLRLVAADPDQELGFLVAPPLLEVPRGGKGYARVRVRARHPFLRGTPRRLPFTVVCEPDAPQGATLPVPGMPVTVSTPERPVVDAGFTHKPILDRWVVVAAAALLAALVALVWWLLRDREEPDDGGAAAVDAPTRVAATAPAPGAVLLTWAAAQGVDSYKVVQTRPTLLEQEVTALVDPADPATFLVRLKVDTADEYCYQLVAQRQDGAASQPSSPEACTPTTLPAGATPSPSPTAVEELPAQGGETPAPLGGAAGGGTAGTPTSPSVPTTPPSSGEAPTAAYVSVLKFYVADPAAPPALAVAEQAALAQVGVPARLVHTDSVTLDPPLAGDGWLLYLQGATAEELAGACEQVLAEHAALVSGLGCVLAPPRAAVATSPGPAVSPTL